MDTQRGEGKYLPSEQARLIVNEQRNIRELRGVPAMLVVVCLVSGTVLGGRYPAWNCYLIGGSVVLGVFVYFWLRPIVTGMAEASAESLQHQIASGDGSLRDALVELAARDEGTWMLVAELLRW